MDLNSAICRYSSGGWEGQDMGDDKFGSWWEQKVTFLLCLYLSIAKKEAIMPILFLKCHKTQQGDSTFVTRHLDGDLSLSSDKICG